MTTFSAVLEVFYMHKQRDGWNDFKRHSPRMQISLKICSSYRYWPTLCLQGNTCFSTESYMEELQLLFHNSNSMGQTCSSSWPLQTHFFFSCFLLSTLIHDIVQTLASACYNLGNTKIGDKHIYIALNGQSACVITMPAMLYSFLCSTYLHDNPLMF